MLNYFRKPSSKCFTPTCLLYILYQILNICLPDWETALTKCCIVCIFEKFTHSRNSNCLSSLSWRKAEGTKNVIYNTAEYLQLSSLSVSGLVLQQTCSSAEGTRDLWRGAGSPQYRVISMQLVMTWGWKAKAFLSIVFHTKKTKTTNYWPLLTPPYYFFAFLWTFPHGQ